MFNNRCSPCSFWNSLLNNYGLLFHFLLSIIIISCISPILLFSCSIISTVPILKKLNNFFHHCDDLKFVFKCSFLIVQISLQFTKQIFIHYKSRPFFPIRFIRYHLAHLTFSCLVFYFLQYAKLMITLSGDIETNPGPNNNYTKDISICHWNLNSLPAHNFIKMSLIEAFIVIDKIDIFFYRRPF